jgi:hypothetical protein
MQRFRRASARVRPWIAVAASYAIALQLMLVGIATSRLVAADAPIAHDVFVLCSATGDGFAGDRPDKPPTRDGACAPCMMTASSSAILVTAPATHFALRSHAFHVEPVADTIVVSSRHSPRQSQGPPPSA